MYLYIPIKYHIICIYKCVILVHKVKRREKKIKGPNNRRLRELAAPQGLKSCRCNQPAVDVYLCARRPRILQVRYAYLCLTFALFDGGAADCVRR